jgi:crotonobetainyl-CoA:carnitine CoA-transferase CaiB-like acyl-CoA transferase
MQMLDRSESLSGRDDEPKTQTSAELDDQKAPLGGIVVLDLTAYIAGPYAATLLGDLGAEVIKIEPPSGDTLRQYPSTLPRESRAFLGINRNKLGIVLDLKQPLGVGVLLRMAKTADVLIHSFRPSVPARLGIDYDRLKEMNPRLIYCGLTGYGETGPLKDKAGYDQVLQSMTGICAFQGRTEGTAKIVYGSIVDYYAGCLLAYAVSSALFRRERTGHGQYIGVSLLQAALAMQSGRFVWAESEGGDVDRDMRSGGVTGIHPTKEGQLYISANTPRFWKSLCELTGLSELAANPDYDTVKKRAARAPEIVPKLHDALSRKTALEWERIFGERVPCCAVRSIEAMFDDPQVLAEDLVATMEHPTVGRYRGLADPVKWSDAPMPKPSPAPALGQHTREVLARYGYSEEEVAALRNAGAIVG